MRTLDMQYQVCNSKTVDFGFHRQTDRRTDRQLNKGKPPLPKISALRAEMVAALRAAVGGVFQLGKSSQI